MLTKLMFRRAFISNISMIRVLISTGRSRNKNCGNDIRGMVATQIQAGKADGLL
jgi:hypothetical protein